MGEQTREAIDFKATAEVNNHAGVWINHLRGADALHYHTKRIDAFNEAKAVLIEIIYQQYCDSLDKNDWRGIREMNQLRSVLRDEAALELARLKDKPRVIYEFLRDEAEMLALKLARRYFTDADEALNLAFRFRKSSDGQIWTSGRDLKGEPRPVRVKIEKVAAEKAEIFRQLNGHAPTFLLTICWPTWAKLNDRQRQAMLHEALSRAWYDGDTGSAAVALPDLAISGETAGLFADALTETQRHVIGDAIRNAIDQGAQLSIFGLMEEDIADVVTLSTNTPQKPEQAAETPEEPAPPAKPRQKPKAASQARNLAKA